MSNDLTAVMGKILARALPVLREECIISRLVNNDMSLEAKEQGDTIDVPIAPEGVVSDVTPGPVDPTPTDSAPTKVQLALDKWKKSNFKMTDKDKLEVSEKTGWLPVRVLSAIKKLANQVNSDIYATYPRVFGTVGTAGTTPFGTGVEELSAIDARKVLNRQLCPREDRRIILDLDAEAKALACDGLADFDKVGSPATDTKVTGRLGTRYGFDFYSDQLVPTHTAGSVTGTIPASAAALDATSVTLTTGVGEAIALKRGDIITFAGHTQTYAVQADLTVGASLTGVVSILPGLKTALAGGEEITVKASHVVNLFFSKNAFAVAVRTHADDTDESGAITMMMADPMTGLPLRLEVRRQHKQTVWEFDILYGAQCVRPELAGRLLG